MAALVVIEGCDAWTHFPSRNNERFPKTKSPLLNILQKKPTRRTH